MDAVNTEIVLVWKVENDESVKVIATKFQVECKKGL